MESKDLNEFIKECSMCKSKDEMIKLLQEELQSTQKQLREIHIHGWKGKDQIDIIDDENNDNFIVITHKKNGPNSKPNSTQHEVSRDYVWNLWQIIKALNIDKTTIRELSLLIIKQYKLEFNNYEEFYGNRNAYHKYAYYPAKILAWLSYVEYPPGSKNITRKRK